MGDLPAEVQSSNRELARVDANSMAVGSAFRVLPTEYWSPFAFVHVDTGLDELAQLPTSLLIEAKNSAREDAAIVSEIAISIGGKDQPTRVL